MFFSPRNNQIIGRTVIKRVHTTIIRSDETKDTTKFVLIDAVGPGAAASGLKRGDVVLANALSMIKIEGGAITRPLIDEKNILAVLHGISKDELAVQIENATEFVSFDDPRAAVSVGAPETAQVEESRERSSRSVSSGAPVVTGAPV